LHVALFAMQVSPQAFPVEHTLQHFALDVGPPSQPESAGAALSKQESATGNRAFLALSMRYLRAVRGAVWREKPLVCTT
jgi:hypothetical protein